MIEVRPAVATDIPALVPLVDEYWAFESIEGFEPERVAAQLRRLLADPRLGAGWIATADGAAVGYLLAVYVFSLEHLGITAEIDEYYVRPAHRGGGIGGRLLDVAEAEFRRTGCTNVSLQLARDNDAARRFYLRRGYDERSGFELLDKMLQER